MFHVSLPGSNTFSSLLWCPPIYLSSLLFLLLLPDAPLLFDALMLLSPFFQKLSKLPPYSFKLGEIILPGNFEHSICSSPKYHFFCVWVTSDVMSSNSWEVWGLFGTAPRHSTSGSWRTKGILALWFLLLWFCKPLRPLRGWQLSQTLCKKNPLIWTAVQEGHFGVKRGRMKLVLFYQGKEKHDNGCRQKENLWKIESWLKKKKKMTDSNFGNGRVRCQTCKKEKSNMNKNLFL